MTTTEIVQNQIGRVTDDLQRIAGEELNVQVHGDAIFAFGSELACLRLEHKYNNRPKCRAAYSENRKSWYFIINL